MPIAQLTGFYGANLKVEPRFLPDGVGVSSINQKPSGRGHLAPWRVPLTITGPVPGAGRKTIYRMGRDTATPDAAWLTWTTIVHAIRAFDPLDPTERTYFTGSGSPKWTDNIQATATAPYPTASRELAVPQPTVAPVVTLTTDGTTGDARQLYYVYTRVNDIGWESAPSPPVLAPAAKPGAVLALSYSESVPAGNYGVTKVRWYRTQVIGNTEDAEYFFLREYLIGASGQEDDARKLGAQLATETWLSLDTSATWLTYAWNEWATALVGKTLRCCEPNYLYAWPIEYEYTLESTPIAQAAFAQRLLVFTADGGEVFLGSHPSALDQKPLALAALVSQRSLAVGDTFCMWSADDGAWYYGLDGYRCLTANSLTAEQWKAMVPSTMAGYLVSIEKRPFYLVFYNDGTLKGLLIDPANPDGIYFLETGYDAAYWDPLLRALFVYDGTNIKQWDAGATFMTATFKSKVFRQTEHTEGEWIELLANGAATAKVWTEQAGATDDATPLVERFSRSITRGEHRLADGTCGRDWQLQLSTATSLTGAVIE